MKILLAQCNFTVGDLIGNSDQIVEIYEKYADAADLVVFTELAISGYYPMDLLNRPGFVDEQDHQLERIAACTRGRRAALIVGCVDRNRAPEGKDYYNALVVYADGESIFRYHKQLLPTYNIFDEARHFEPGVGGAMFDWQGRRMACMICEDGWNDRDDPLYRCDPVDAIASQAPDIIISINASPCNLGKHAQRLALFAATARRCQAPLVYVNQVGGNDQIVYDGNSFVVDAEGCCLLQLPAFEAAEALFDSAAGPMPLASPVEADEESTLYRILRLGLQDYMRKCGFSKVVVGCSGGIDSAVTLALAVDALGAECVNAIAMPGPFSSAHSVNDAVELCANLGIRLYKAPIVDAYDQAVHDFHVAFGAAASLLTCENIQARLRGQTLMAFANHYGHLVLSTGNKSEMSVGYATLYGDMNGGLNLLGDLYKMEVYRLARYYNQLHHSAIIPEHILTKEPSAELSPDQKDSDSLPPYPVLDAILRLAIERDLLSPREIAEARAIIRSVPVETVSAVMQKVDRAEFKRHQAPPIIRVHARAFGWGRRLPIAQRHIPYYRESDAPV